MNLAALGYAGAMGTVALTFVFAAAFFVQTWRHRPRDAEYFIFGLLALCQATYAAAAAMGYLALGTDEAPALRATGNLASAAVVASLALLVHFALRYVRSRSERAVMRIVYPLMGVFGLLVVFDAWWLGEPTVETVALFGGSFPVLRARPTIVPIVFGLCEAIAFPAVILLLFRSYRSGRRESVAALVGSVLLLAAAVSDTLGAALGLFPAPPLLSLGFLFFAYVMSLTLVERYGRQSLALADREADLGRRSSELGRALAELEQTQADLVHAEQLAVVGEFAAVITHEVRNPMQIVTNAVSSLRRVRGVTDHTRSLLGIIEEEMVRLERLVSHLLDYARPVVPQTKLVDLEDLLLGCLSQVEPYPDVEASLGCAGEWPDLEADADLLRHAFDNLVQNALQAMDARGELRVRVARRRVDRVACAVIGFEDTGEGMTEQQIEQARMPFYTTRPSGTGLGLAICDRIVDAHGGRLVIASEGGRGTAISVLLPLAPGARLEGER